MSRIWKKIGTITYWLCWPMLFIYLRFTRRTRVLVICEDEILVVRGWLADDKWYLPGGGLHSGEEKEAGAIRELYEETKLKLKPSELNYLGPVKAHTHGLSFWYESFYVVLNAKPKVERQKWEISDIAWIGIDRLSKTNATSAVLDSLSAWKRLSVSDTM